MTRYCGGCANHICTLLGRCEKRAASGMEARQGGNEVPSRSDDSPTAEGGDAHRRDR
jgi:hypothetical protein